MPIGVNSPTIEHISREIVHRLPPESPPLEKVPRKNITREYKAKLTKDQRKAFRSQMWAFRRDPESLSAEEKQALEALFEKIPALRPLYKVRLRFKEILIQRATESRPRVG